MPENFRPNGLRYRGAGDHVESYFIKATAPDARRAIWIKATVLASAREPERAVAEGWAIAYDARGPAARHVAVKHTVPYRRASFHAERLAIDWTADVHRIHLDGRKTSGTLGSGGRRIAWELELDGEERAFELLPHRWMYRAPLPSTKTVTPLPNATMRGSVEVDGARWTIDGWRAMQGHNWGRRHGEYAWLHCNAFDADLTVEAGSSRQRLGPVLTPYITSVMVRHRGVDHAFSVPRALWSSHADVTMRSYAFSAAGPNGRVSGLCEAPVEQFVGLRYDNPSGPAIACLNCKLASARIRFEPTGGPVVEAFSAAAALEIGTSRTDHGVAIHV